MKRRLFPILSAMSLSLCVATCLLWVRSRQHADCVGRVIRGNRYTIISNAGMIGLYGPPPMAGDARVRHAAEQVVAALHNRQVRWIGWYTVREDEPCMNIDWPEPFPDTPAERAETQFTRETLARPLLAALEDPQRMLAAHMVLLWDWPQSKSLRPRSHPIPDRQLGECPTDYGNGQHQDTPWTEVNLDGLKVTLNHWENPEIQLWGYTSLGEWIHGLTGDHDLAQLPSIRDQWHRRLDIRHAAIAHWQLAIATALLPLLTFGRMIQQRVLAARRRQTGRCPACGYDLRATTGRCPECGMVSLVEKRLWLK